MRKIKIIAVIVSGLLGANFLQAQEQLTLQQAIRYALENKAEAQKSKLDIENAQYQIDEVRSGALPQVNLSASLTYNPIIQQVALDGALMGMPGETILVAMGQKWQSQPVLSLNQQLFNQSLFTGLKAANSTKEFYQINDQLTEEQLIEKVANSYYNVFQTRLQIKTLEDNLGSTSKTQKIIEGSYDAGLARKIDLDRITVSVNNLKSQRQQLINALELQENALKFAIGMDMQRNIVLPDETFGVNAEVLAEQYGVDMRSEIQIMNKQIELLELNKQAMRADYFPTLSIGANYGYMGFGQQFPIFNNHSSVAWANFMGVTLNLAFPIFDGHRTRSRIRQADIDIRKAKVDLGDTKLALAMGNENAKTQIKNSLLTINSNEENVKLAKEVLDNTNNNYQNGLATLTELLDAERAYADAQNNYTTSLLNYKVAEIQLIKARGELKSLVNQ